MSRFLGYPTFIDPNEFLDSFEKRYAVKVLVEAINVLKVVGKDIYTGKAIRAALVFMRFIFMSGLNNVTCPFSCL